MSKDIQLDGETPRILYIGKKKPINEKILLRLLCHNTGYIFGSSHFDETKIHDSLFELAPHLVLIDLEKNMGYIEKIIKLLINLSLPIIILDSEKGDKKDTVRWLNKGVEDVVIKPEYLGIIIARIRNILINIHDLSYIEQFHKRRIKFEDGTTIIFISDTSVNAFKDDRFVSFTPSQSFILHILFKNRGRKISTSFLIQKLGVAATIRKLSTRKKNVSGVHSTIWKIRNKLKIISGNNDVSHIIFSKKGVEAYYMMPKD